MGGELVIARMQVGCVDPWDDRASFSFDEWQVAMRTTPGVRPSESVHIGRNPKTGAEVRIPASVNCAEVQIADGSWVPLACWRDGRAFFHLPPEETIQTSPLMKKVFELAESLHASVVDSRSGDVLNPPGT